MQEIAKELSDIHKLAQRQIDVLNGRRHLSSSSWSSSPLLPSNSRHIRSDGFGGVSSSNGSYRSCGSSGNDRSANVTAAAMEAGMWSIFWTTILYSIFGVCMCVCFGRRCAKH